MGQEATKQLHELDLQLESGSLKVQAVGVNALSFLEAKYSLHEFYEAISKGDDDTKEWLSSLTPERDAEISRGLDLVLNYCLTWGVAEDPPDEDLDVLAAMGIDVSNPKIARLYWLRIIRLDGNEAVMVQNSVRALTQGRFVEMVDNAKAESEGK